MDELPLFDTTAMASNQPFFFASATAATTAAVALLKGDAGLPVLAAVGPAPGSRRGRLGMRGCRKQDTGEPPRSRIYASSPPKAFGAARRLGCILRGAA